MSDEFLTLIRAVVAGDAKRVHQILARRATLATTASKAGATRQGATSFFFEEIRHYLYAGDTALHMAAAALQPSICETLIKNGADVLARNRRGAQPLHYAADTNVWKPAAQSKTIEYLLAVGADPNAQDKSGVSPLHRAVRTRSSPAVEALLAGGADVHQTNRRGSTPLELARWDTGRGGAGSVRARAEQARIVAMLVGAGARQQP